MAKSLDWYKTRVDYTNITGLSGIRRLPREGKIRLGIKVPNPKKKNCRKDNHPGEEMCMMCSYPKDLDYFVVPPEVAKVYGDKPKVLDIFFPSENIGQIHPQSLRWYKGPRLICKGNGETATRIDEKTGRMFSIPCAEVPACPCEHYGGNCKQRSSLMVMLPKITMNGVYQIDTGSSSNIIEINSSLDYFQNFLLGRVAFVPLLLKRVPTKIMTPDHKQVTKNLLKLEFVGNIEDVARFRRHDAIGGRGLPEKEARALPPPEEPEEIEEEQNGVIVIGEDSTIPQDIQMPDQGKGKDDEAPQDKEATGRDSSPDDSLGDNQGGDPGNNDKENNGSAPDENREPGADEQEDEVPFPENGEQIHPEGDETIASWLRAALPNKNTLKQRFLDDVVKNASLTPEQKGKLQAVFDECMKKAR